jgi:hypothetical protein
MKICIKILSFLNGQTYIHRGYENYKLSMKLNINIEVLNDFNSKVTLRCWSIKSFFFSILNNIILVMLSCAIFKVKFIMKQVNSVAHTLARSANS